MIIKTVLGIPHTGNPPLGIGTVGFLNLVLGQNHRPKRRVDLLSRTHSGKSTADDKHVGKVMPHAFRIDRHEVSRNPSGPRGRDPLGLEHLVVQCRFHGRFPNDPSEWLAKQAKWLNG